MSVTEGAKTTLVAALVGISTTATKLLLTVGPFSAEPAVTVSG